MKRFTRCAGFTLVELLVVIAIIGILAGLLFPLVTRAQKSAKKAKASTEVRAIATAIEAYYNEYGKLPIPDDVQGVYDSGNDVVSRGTYHTTDLDSSDSDLGSREVIKILTANDTDASGNSTLDASHYGEVMNPKGMVFLEAQTAGNTENTRNGVFLDPWGQQYRIAFDSDYNDKMEFFSGGKAADEVVTKSVIAYSLGPDQKVVPAGVTLPNREYKDFIASHF